MSTMPTIPPAGDMNREPALTIGKMFANKTLVQPVISAVVVILASVLKFTVADDLVDNLTTIAIFVGALWGAIASQREQKQLATNQAKETREAVYAPATVQRIAHDASVTGDATIDPPLAR